MLARLEKTLDRLALAIALAASATLLVVALATMADVLLRWLLNAPIRGLVDLAGLLTAVVVAASFPMAMARGGNVTIRLLGGWLGPRVGRVLDAFGALVAAVFLALMAWQYVRFSLEMGEAGEATPILRWPAAPWWWVVTAMIVVAAVIGIVVFLRTAAGRPPPDGDAPH
jgi:TRAP-type C4-dicarboxylate transport system permease small subunit